MTNQESRTDIQDTPWVSTDLDLEFDQKRNFPRLLKDFGVSDKAKLWWICPSGHSYESSLASRRYQNSGCPYCRNQKTLKGFNDMATTHPQLAAEFDVEKNKPITPDAIVAGVRRNLWWLCPQGHSYESRGYTRVYGTGCPFCINKRVLPGFNDMATTHPQLAAEFDVEKNKPITPDAIVAGTHMRLWWLCQEGHGYQASGMKRSGEGTGCPICANKKVLPGVNDMATIAPQLVAHFHPTKNAPNTPNNLAPRTNKMIWWLCDEGHEYQAKTGNRLQLGGLGCPVCSNHQVLAGFNDLATTRPDLVETWHPTKNLPVTPQMVLAGTNKKFWWKCSEGHEWNALLNNRSRGRDCPRCATYGYDSTRPGWLYFIVSRELGARKIGISNHEVKRLADYDNHWLLIQSWHNTNGLKIAEVERKTLKWLRKEKGLQPYLGQSEMGSAGGATETFSVDGVSDLEVIKFIDDSLE